VGQGGHSKSMGLKFFYMRREIKIISWEQVCFVHHRIISAIKRVEFISDRVPYTVLRGRWCNIVLNVHEKSEYESDYSRDSFTRNWSRFFLSFS
jgi:hypothetical protein